MKTQESALTGINRINFAFKRALISNLFPDPLLCIIAWSKLGKRKEEGKQGGRLVLI